MDYVIALTTMKVERMIGVTPNLEFIEERKRYVLKKSKMQKIDVVGVIIEFTILLAGNMYCLSYCVPKITDKNLKIIQKGHVVIIQPWHLTKIESNYILMQFKIWLQEGGPHELFSFALSYQVNAEL